VQELLAGETGVFVAASDYMKALPLSISRWVPGPYVVLGTDGYGLSESRPDLRAWFEVSAEYVAWAALAALNETGVVGTEELAAAGVSLGIDHHKGDPAYCGPANPGDP
jgi:pyruvate dehydrogenase E1 component